MKIIRFGSRRSRLALAQTRLVMDAVRRALPDCALEVVPIVTAGDLNMKPFSEASDPAGLKGLFTQELEQALRDGAIDVAVHSLKDLPASLPPDLPLIACCRRDDPRDALVLAENNSSGALDVIGCSSARRRIQALDLFPGTRVEPVRGNVETRLRKLDHGDFSALLLAAAGLNRLGLQGRATRLLSPDECVPAPGQGILACQGRSDGDYGEWLAAVYDPDSSDCAAAERAFSARLNGGCAAPVGACARIAGTEMKLTGFFADEKRGIKLRASIVGARDEARALGERLAERFLKEAR